MIEYIKGDATFPERITPDKKNLIVHIVNDIGAWGAGFVMSVNQRWTKPMYQYKQTYKMKQLGDIDIIQVEKNIAVVNLFGQKGIRNQNNPQPVDYNAIRQGLIKIRQLTYNRSDIAIHMPKIGSGLAGGNWNVIEQIINDIFQTQTIYVYQK